MPDHLAAYRLLYRALAHLVPDSAPRIALVEMLRDLRRLMTDAERRDAARWERARYRPKEGTHG